MKHYIFSFLICLLIGSCQKEETPAPNVPDWFQPQIKELESSGECYDCTITQITYFNKFYYHLYCGYWSCMYCKLYDNEGNLVEWENEDFNNFLENKNSEKVIWECGD